MKDRNRKTGNKEARKRKGSGKKRLAAGGRLSEELCKYGYVFDMRKSFVRYGVAAAASFLLGWYFSLGGWYLLALCVWVCLLLPFFLLFPDLPGRFFRFSTSSPFHLKSTPGFFFSAAASA